MVDYPWINVLNRPGDEIPYSPLQQDIFQHFKCFDVTDVQSDVKLSFHIRIHHEICEGKTQGPYVIHLDWMGGGLCTGGEPTYYPWHQCYFQDILTNKTIMICPRYPLMPAQFGLEIENYVKAVLAWLGTNRLQEIIKSRYSNITDGIQTNQLDTVTGESAGGYLAMLTWLLPSDVTIERMFLHSPMVTQYTREPGQKYMGREQDRESIKREAMKVLVDRFDHPRHMVPQLGLAPPKGMGVAYLWSSTMIPCVQDGGASGLKFSGLKSVWQIMYQGWSIIDRLKAILGMDYYESHTELPSAPIVISPRKLVEQLQGTEKLKEFGFQFLPGSDSLGFEMEPASTYAPKWCPRIVILQGTKDTNTPHIHVEKLVSLIRERWPESQLTPIYAEDEPHVFAYRERGKYVFEALKAFNEGRDTVDEP